MLPVVTTTSKNWLHGCGSTPTPLPLPLLHKAGLGSLLNPPYHPVVLLIPVVLLVTGLWLPSLDPVSHNFEVLEDKIFSVPLYIPIV